ncbi:2-dehydro-3-deoxy-D-gluconate 5-dehydrogenase KduD [Stappia sp. GBMRC 2046]|uniref:2-dehydro-3-deoxy-D-gluconate 5-dehydrogenase KduD n=1 Tax=Stappia sediminis TaxID=2692190 RepID=A0A7X3LYA1_9HYPH|nr:2-dehydro-3-deoxy-D-gluconate 5-dehydrogenase KduD [Stappia sediminis]MXN67278.1 2-dehydro-3-deoxy-D-gluconate 5-dehydrogenase KduD [Stappia sediminis]
MSNPFSLEGRTAVVTGANTGIGQAAAVALAQAGARIAVVGRSSMDETIAKIGDPGRVHAISADLSRTANLAPVIDEAVAWAGGVDILVNNAGIIRRNDALDFTEDDWDAVIDINLKSAFFLSQAAARHMKEHGGGRIINIASLLSFQGGIRVASYTASKSGLVGLTRVLACEWASLGINVNAVAPGYVVTNNTEALRNDPARYKAILERIPAGRWAEPEDISGAVTYLASDAARYVHGIVIPVDGGWLAR